MLPRLLKVIAGLAAAAAFGFAVWHFRLWERDWSTIDDGWASLIGSAMGSFLAVVGALYVSKSEERRKKKEFVDFVRENAQNLVVQASFLEAMAREPHKIASTPEVQAGIISIQLRNLTDALAVFDREIANSKNGGYQLRRRIVGLDAMLAEVRHGLSIEAHPAQTINNWHIAAYQVRQHAINFLDGFSWLVPIPTSKHVVDNAAQIIRAWKSWNIPVNDIAPPVSHHDQPLHHTTA